MNRRLPVLMLLYLTACSGSEDPYAMLAHHDGYWVTEVDNDELPVPVTVINDLHVDVETRRNTVYAQAILNWVRMSAKKASAVLSYCAAHENGDRMARCFL